MVKLENENITCVKSTDTITADQRYANSDLTVVSVINELVG